MKQIVAIITCVLVLGFGLTAYANEFQQLINKISSWAEAPLPHTDDLTPIEKDAYAIFEDIWTPTNLRRLGEFEVESFEDWYAHSPYLLVQNKLQTRSKSWLGNSTIHVIENFVPRVNRPQGKIIILTDERRNILTSFLSNKEHTLGDEGILTPFQTKGEFKDRAILLKEVLPIQHGHWGGWNLVTYPEILEIVFNRRHTEATVNFRVGYQGGIANYKKRNDRWEFISSQCAWIE